MTVNKIKIHEIPIEQIIEGRANRKIDKSEIMELNFGDPFPFCAYDYDFCRLIEQWSVAKHIYVRNYNFGNENVVVFYSNERPKSGKMYDNTFLHRSVFNSIENARLFILSEIERINSGTYFQKEQTTMEFLEKFVETENESYFASNMRVKVGNKYVETKPERYVEINGIEFLQTKLF